MPDWACDACGEITCGYHGDANPNTGFVPEQCPTGKPSWVIVGGGQASTQSTLARIERALGDLASLVSDIASDVDGIAEATHRNEWAIADVREKVAAIADTPTDVEVRVLPGDDTLMAQLDAERGLRDTLELFEVGRKIFEQSNADGTEGVIVPQP